MGGSSRQGGAPRRAPARRGSEGARRGPPARPTIADVAEHAGVSRAAVSFAVNGRPGVAETTRARILRAADELGWRPSGPARALTHARAGAIGFGLAHRSADQEVDDFFVRFLAGVEQTLAAHEYDFMLQVVSPDAQGRLDAYRRLVSSGRIDGVLLTDVVLDDPRLDLIAESGLPAVVAGRPWGRCSLPGRRDRTRPWHADARGAPDRSRAPRDRIRRGRPGARVHRCAPMGVDGDDAQRGSRSRPVSVCRPGGLRGTCGDRAPAAVAAPSDGDRLHERSAGAGAAWASPASWGCRCPTTCRSPASTTRRSRRSSSPPLTTVRIDSGGFGQAAASMLLAEIEGLPLPTLELAPPKLIRRSSTGPAPEGSDRE